LLFDEHVLAHICLARYYESVGDNRMKIAMLRALWMLSYGDIDNAKHLVEHVKTLSDIRKSSFIQWLKQLKENSVYQGIFNTCSGKKRMYSEEGDIFYVNKDESTNLISPG